MTCALKWLILTLFEQKSLNIWVVNLIITQLDQSQETNRTYKNLFDKFQEKIEPITNCLIDLRKNRDL